MVKHRQSSRIPINPERIKEALRLKGLKPIDLEGIKQVQTTERTIRRCFKDGLMKPQLIQELSTYLNVDEGYLKGDYDWPLEELEGEPLKRYKEWLRPENFPRSISLQESVDYQQHFEDMLALHGIAIEEFKKLPTNERFALEESFKVNMRKTLNKYFPNALGIYKLYGYKEPVRTKGDVMEMLVDEDDLQVDSDPVQITAP